MKTFYNEETKTAATKYRDNKDEIQTDITKQLDIEGAKKIMTREK